MPEVLEADVILGLSFGNSDLIRIDPRSAAAKPVGNIGIKLGGMEDLTLAPSGRDAIGVFWEGYPGLLTLNLVTGKATAGPKLTGPVLGERSFVEAIVFVDGVLYGSASNKDSYCLDCAHRLIKIDPKSGAVTDVGPFGPRFLTMEAMAYSPKYGLIGADIGTLVPPDFQKFNTKPSLVKIDPRTGQATKIGDLPPETTKLVGNPVNTWLSPEGPFVCSLTFAPDDTLYGATIPTHFGGVSELFVIDPTTAEIRDRVAMDVKNVDAIVYVRPPKSVESAPAPK